MNPQNIYSPFPTPYPDTIKDATVIDTFFGDDHRRTKLPHHFRFLFNNINGLVLTHTDLINFISITKELQADWVGIVETHIASEKSHVRDCVFSAFQSKQGYNNLNAVFASSDMDFDVDRKFGGVLQIAVNSLASRTITKHSNKYGWFTSQTHTGKNGKMLTTITAYRIAAGTGGDTSAHAQQRMMLVTEERDIIDPRRLIIDDLIVYITHCQESGHDILLCIDANESMEKPASQIRRLANTCNLLDVHANLHLDETLLPSHSRGSEKIDFCLASPPLLDCITRSGILALDDAYMSDHRAMFLDLDIKRYFKGITTDLVSRQSRSFTTKNEKLTAGFNSYVSDEWLKRKMTGRIKIMDTLSRLPDDQIDKSRIQRMWEAIDTQIGIIFLQGEQSLNIPNKIREWSPALAKSGAERRYWKARLQNATMDRCGKQSLSHLANKYAIIDDGTTDQLTLEQRLDEATRHHAHVSKRDVDFRDHHMDSLIADLELKSDPDSKNELNKLKAMKKAEKQMKTFAKIRRLLKPRNSGALSRLELPKDMAIHIDAQPDIPVEGRITNNNPELKDILQQTIRVKRHDGAEEWVTLLDKRKIESALLQYCNEHYQQAAATPLGSSHLANLLGTAGLTEAGKQIIDGTLFNCLDESNFPELSTFLAQLAMPEDIKSMDPIPTEITVDEYHKGFRSWRETTSTSPSGRHLGIYKALLALDHITSDMCMTLNVVIRLGLVPSR